MPDVAPIVELLHRARAGLEAAAGAVPEELWNRRPQPGAWSAAEVVAHLATAEAAITDGAAKMIQREPRTVPFWKRLHVPVVAIEWRFYKARSPIPTDPSLLGKKGPMLARMAELRLRTLKLLEETAGRDLRAYRWPHPFFGSIHFYDWFRVVAHHEVRHTKQIREIVEFFQK
jgi:hypothetical protein